VPGFGPGQYAEGQNLANWIDKMFLPGRKWDGDHDPEGLLSTLPAIASCLLGVLSGIWLRTDRAPQAMRALALAIAGALVYSLGHLWGLHFPVIKKIWTSSFVLEAGGIAAMALAAFYLVIDVWKIRSWAAPFVWVGANALTIYLLCNVVEFGPLARRFVGGSVESVLDRTRVGMGGLVAAVLSVCLCFAVARFLYRRKIFLRL
jgi:predicted acyltransferase